MKHFGVCSIAVACLLLFEIGRAQTAPKGPWAPLQFLVGTWVGEGSGEPGASGTGGSTFSFDLDKKIFVRKNWAKYPPRPGEKTGTSHKDLMILYSDPAGASVRAIYFDNEGHVISYVTSFPAKQSVTFESDVSQPDPRYRLTYELRPDNKLVVVFSIAAPGQAFKEYTRGLLHRQ